MSINIEYLKQYGHNFSEEEQRFLETALMERRGEDLYIYDPHGELGITLGDSGSGWCCLHEEYFSEVQEEEDNSLKL